MTTIPTIDWRSPRTATTTDEIKTITHDLHPTGLEQFMTCPFKFDVQANPEKYTHLDITFGTPATAREAFYEGDITEQLMTAYQYGEKLGDEVLRNF